VAVIGLMGLGAWAQEPTLTPELMAVDPAPIEAPAAGNDAVQIAVEPDGSGGRVSADASNPGGVWAWITGNPIKSTLISAGTTYLVVQGSRGKLESDMNGLGRALRLSEHDQPKTIDDGSAASGSNTAVAPPGGTAVSVSTSGENSPITIIIGDGSGNVTAHAPEVAK